MSIIYICTAGGRFMSLFSITARNFTSYKHILISFFFRQNATPTPQTQNAEAPSTAGQGYNPPAHLGPAYLTAFNNLSPTHSFSRLPSHQDYLNAAAQRLGEQLQHQAAAAFASDEATRLARKRALSPYTQDSHDLNNLLRHSPIDSTATASLQLGAALAVAAAGGSPSSSGSYEHLSGAVSPVLHLQSSAHHLQQLQAHLLRSSPYLSPQNSFIHSAAAAAAAAAFHSGSTSTQSPSYFPLIKAEEKKAVQAEQEPSSSNVVSSTMEEDSEESEKTPPRSKSIRAPASSSTGDQDLEGGNKDEPDFIETNCHWLGCEREFESQDQLVKVRKPRPIFLHLITKTPFSK